MAPLESKVLCCIKCPKTGEVKLNNKDIYCQGCFVHYVTHKFRGCLGKHKAIKNGEKVMVAISGGHSSTAMLNLLHSGFREEIHKKLKMSPVLVHIFEDSVNIETTMESLMSIMQLTSIPTFAFHLGLVFSDFPQDLQPLQSSKDPLIGSEHSGNLDLLLESFKSSTAKLDVVEKLRLYLLHTIAVKLNCTKVLLGDSGSRLAVRVFTHTALARGSQIQDDSTFNDRRYSVPFLRPMKDLTAKEVSLLNHYSRPDAIESWKYDMMLASDADPISSIQGLTEGFLEGLQQNFPATVCAIVSTSGKLATTPNIDKSTGACHLCFSANDSDNDVKNLCFACQSILNDCDQQLLPMWLRQAV